MNDRAVNILDNYELQILRTWKGRGAILCETDQGIRILKEYTGSKEKLILEQILLQRIRENGFSHIEEILSDKEGKPYYSDDERTTYFVKSYFEGRECNIKDQQECRIAVRTLANLHRAMICPDLAAQMNLNCLPIQYEFEKRNKELHRVRKFLKEKSQKTEFELFLQKNYDYFYEKAIQTTEELSKYPLQKWLEDLHEEGSFCHGDFQYHNLLFSGDGTVSVINFEKATLDSPVRDLYLFMRKLLEKNSWNSTLGAELLEEYEKERMLTVNDRIQLLYRFLYPEKFWKIVNFYYNSTKSWIPLRYKEKLEKIIEQEDNREYFIEQVLQNIR